METLTIKQKTISATLALVFNGTPLFIGIALGELLNMMILFGIFAVGNIIMEKFKLKNHAEVTKDGDEWKDIAACYFSSNVLLLVCLLIMRFSGCYIPQWQVVFLGIIVVTISTVIVSNVFYVKPKSENIETKKSLRDIIQGLPEDEAFAYLRKQLPEDLSKAILWLDWHEKDLEYVAYHISYCSVTVLKERRKSAYSRIRQINSNIQ